MRRSGIVGKIALEDALGGAVSGAPALGAGSREGPSCWLREGVGIAVARFELPDALWQARCEMGERLSALCQGKILGIGGP